MTNTQTEAPSPGGVHVRPGSAADLLGFTNSPQSYSRGEALSAAIREVLPPEALASARRSIWWQCRKGLYPVASAGALWTTAYVMHDGGANPWYVPAGALLVGLGGLAVAKIRTWVGKALWRQNWYGGALAAACAWTTAAAVVGPGLNTPMPTLLVLGGSLVAAPWWWVNRPKPGLPVVAPPIPAISPAPPVFAPEGPHPDQEVWDKHLGGNQKPLKGTRLIDAEPITDPSDGKPNGRAWTIDGSEAKVTQNKMFGALDEVKAAYDRDFVDSLVYIEGSPKGRITQGRVILLDRNPLVKVVEWDRPHLDRKTGIVEFAIYPDGSGWAPYVMFRPNWGPEHDLLAGGTGSGKTTALKQIAIESMAMGNAVILFDPHAGAEFGDSVEYFTETFLSQAEIYVGMHGMEAVLDERMKIVARVGKKNFGPDHGHPIIHAITDEATVPLGNPDINRIVARLTQEGRKAWIKKSIALQVPSVENLGDAGMSIREQLSSGNIMIYRVTQRMTGAMAYQGDLPVAPTSLPKYFDNDPTKPTMGLGYVISGSGRALQSRSQLVEDEMFARWIKRVPQMDPESAEAFRRGIQLGLAKLAEKNPDADLSLTIPATAQMASVTPIRREPARSDSAASSVLAFIQDQGGVVRTEEIVNANLCGASTVSRVLGELTDTGHIEKVAHGKYSAVATTAAQ